MKERNACGLEDMDVLSSSLKRVTARCGKASGVRGNAFRGRMLESTPKQQGTKGCFNKVASIFPDVISGYVSIHTKL